MTSSRCSASPRSRPVGADHRSSREHGVGAAARLQREPVHARDLLQDLLELVVDLEDALESARRPAAGARWRNASPPQGPRSHAGCTSLCRCPGSCRRSGWNRASLGTGAGSGRARAFGRPREAPAALVRRMLAGSRPATSPTAAKISSPGAGGMMPRTPGVESSKIIGSSQRAWW